MPSAPTSRAPRSARPTCGIVSGGNPWGSDADQGDPVIGEVEHARRDDREHDHDQDAGDPGQPALEDEDHDAARTSPTASGGRHRLTIGDARRRTR